MSLLILCGLEREAALARAPGRTVFASGARPERLRAFLSELDPSGVDAVVSFGLAGGLDPVLAAGDVLTAAAVIAGQGTWPRPCDAVLVTALRTRLPGSNYGMLAGVDEPVLDPSAKADLRTRTGCVAVDMESHLAAEWAVAHRKPFAVLRAISDPAERALPPLARVATRPDGRLDLAAIARSLVRDPAQLLGLPATARDARAAFSALARAAAVLSVLERGPSHDSLPPRAGPL